MELLPGIFLALYHPPSRVHHAPVPLDAVFGQRLLQFVDFGGGDFGLFQAQVDQGRLVFEDGRPGPLRSFPSRTSRWTAGSFGS
jgi:hypothetical protein